MGVALREAECVALSLARVEGEGGAVTTAEREAGAVGWGGAEEAALLLGASEGLCEGLLFALALGVEE